MWEVTLQMFGEIKIIASSKFEKSLENKFHTKFLGCSLEGL